MSYLYQPKSSGRRRSAALTAACAALALLSLPRIVAAADTQLAWDGFLKVTASTSQCAAAGIGGVAIGAEHISVFRPKILSTDTPTFISIIDQLAAVSFENTSETTIHQMHGSGNYSATAINGKAKAFTFTGTYKFTISPASVTAATTEVGITGTINNYFNAAGCSVSFDAFYAPEP
jgi:hypothetical protein